MKSYWTLKIFALAMLLLMTTSVANADEWSGHFNLSVLLKTLKSDDWPNLNKHFCIGFITDIKRTSWPISIALDKLDTGSEYEHDGQKDLGHTTEYHIGVRKIFMTQHSKIQPYIGGGVSLMYAEQEYNKIKEDEEDVGIWFGTGMYYEINPRFVLGLDVRYSQGELILFDKKRDPGGIYTGVTGGFQF